VQHLDRRFLQQQQEKRGGQAGRQAGRQADAQQLKLSSVIRVFRALQSLAARCLAAVPTCPVTGRLQHSTSPTYHIPSGLSLSRPKPTTSRRAFPFPFIFPSLPFSLTLTPFTPPLLLRVLNSPHTACLPSPHALCLRLPVPDHPPCDSIRPRLTAPTLPLQPYDTSRVSSSLSHPISFSVA